MNYNYTPPILCIHFIENKLDKMTDESIKNNNENVSLILIVANELSYWYNIIWYLLYQLGWWKSWYNRDG